MSDGNLTIEQQSPHPIPLSPRRPKGLKIRPATMEDLPFIDRLQRLHTRMVGWMPMKQLEGKIRAGHVIVAEEENQTADNADDTDKRLNSSASSALSAVKTPLGYCIGHDQYFKRDDVGIIYQINIAPTEHRQLIGATLIKAMFDRAAYGCKLFCCWCAQDIEANHFWESLGFVPLAFRTGSSSKQRTHIFWQRRIREGDTSTPYWFPSQTTGGSIREDRLVLPIPPGTSWRDAKPVVLPSAGNPQLQGRNPKQIQHPKRKMENRRILRLNGISFAPPPSPEPEKPKPAPKPRAKNDPKLVAAARELRDRWLEQVNAGQYLPETGGKYEVSRQFAPTLRRLPVERGVLDAA